MYSTLELSDSCNHCAGCCAETGGRSGRCTDKAGLVRLSGSAVHPGHDRRHGHRGDAQHNRTSDRWPAQRGSTAAFAAVRSSIRSHSQAELLIAGPCSANLVGCWLVSVRSKARRLDLVRSGEGCSPGSACPCRGRLRVLRVASRTAVMVGGESLSQSLERGRGRFGRGVTPVEDNGRVGPVRAWAGRSAVRCARRR